MEEYIISHCPFKNALSPKKFLRQNITVEILKQHSRTWLWFYSFFSETQHVNDHIYSRIKYVKLLI